MCLTTALMVHSSHHGRRTQIIPYWTFSSHGVCSIGFRCACPRSASLARPELLVFPLQPPTMELEDAKSDTARAGGHELGKNSETQLFPASVVVGPCHFLDSDGRSHVPDRPSLQRAVRTLWLRCILVAICFTGAFYSLVMCLLVARAGARRCNSLGRGDSPEFRVKSRIFLRLMQFCCRTRTTTIWIAEASVACWRRKPRTFTTTQRASGALSGSRHCALGTF